MPKYRKKPVVIEAMLHDVNSDDPMAVYQWVEKHTLGSFEPMACINGSKPYPESGISIDPRDGRLLIATLEGGMHVDIGDYIIKGIAGEFYPCKPDIFAKTYEQVNETTCTAPVDPDHELTEDEIKRLNETGSLCDCADFTQYGGDCPIEEGDEFDFGSALYLTQKGEKVMRAGWNGKGMFVCRMLPAECSDLDGNKFEHSEHLVLKTADNKIVPWTISQTDALATDWCLA